MKKFLPVEGVREWRQLKCSVTGQRQPEPFYRDSEDDFVPGQLQPRPPGNRARLVIDQPQFPARLKEQIKRPGNFHPNACDALLPGHRPTVHCLEESQVPKQIILEWAPQAVIGPSVIIRQRHMNVAPALKVRRVNRPRIYNPFIPQDVCHSREGLPTDEISVESPVEDNAFCRRERYLLPADQRSFPWAQSNASAHIASGKSPAFSPPHSPLMYVLISSAAFLLL